jgi:hypothetical protein
VIGRQVAGIDQVVPGGADIPHPSQPTLAEPQFDYFPFVIVAVGIAVGVVWRRHGKKLEPPEIGHPASGVGKRKSKSAQERA